MRVLFWTRSGPEIIVMPSCAEVEDVKKKALELDAPMYTPLAEVSDVDLPRFLADVERRLFGRRVVGE